MKDYWNIKTIVLGYDGSRGAEEAAQLASSVARRNSARLVVVTVFHGPDIAGTGEMGGRINPEMGAAQATAQALVAKLQAAGIQAEADVLEGNAPEAVLRAAETHKADLIVVGRRGHGLLAGLLLGSTSEYVVRRAKVPVLVAH